MVPAIESKTTSSDCLSIISDHNFKIQLEGPKVKQCGVKRCINANSNSKHQRKMCLNLRMSTVKGIKLPEDALISVQCSPQPTVLTHVKEFRLRAEDNSRQRSIGRTLTVASGGTQKNLDMKLSLLRKSDNSLEFNEVVQADTPVFLGEDLLLRASIKDGSGWHYTRMDSVIMKSATTQKSAVLIDENGCVNPNMKNICPEQPRQINPLVVLLPFRAFQFQGIDETDEMVLSLRMIGCINAKECLQINRCNDVRATASEKRRSSRSTKVDEEVADIEMRFKVLPFQHQTNSKSAPVLNLREIASFDVIVLILCFILIIISIVLIITVLHLLRRSRK